MLVTDKTVYFNENYDHAYQVCEYMDSQYPKAQFERIQDAIEYAQALIRLHDWEGRIFIRRWIPSEGESKGYFRKIFDVTA